MNKTISNHHIPVQKDNVIDYLNIKENGTYVDCTFGYGGHSLSILKKLSKKGKLIGIDRDQFSYQYYLDNFKQYNNLIFINDKFSNIKQILNDLKINKVDGILFDLGVSSPQIDNANRGFSYIQDGPLDMRMDNNQKLKAFDVINFYSQDKLINIFKEYGDVNYHDAFFVSKAIVEIRKEHPIETTFELKKIILDNVSKKNLFKKSHIEKNFFQAIRIEVNSEIEEIKKGFSNALDFLDLHARLVSISFHSLEEKIIKQVYISKLPKQLPKEIPVNNYANNFKIVNIEGFANEKEIESNKRAKSSKIKIIERISFE